MDVALFFWFTFMSFPIATDTKPDAPTSDFIVTLFTDQVILGMADFNVTDDEMKFVLPTTQLVYKESLKEKDCK